MKYNFSPCTGSTGKKPLAWILTPISKYMTFIRSYGILTIYPHFLDRSRLSEKRETRWIPIDFLFVEISINWHIIIIFLVVLSKNYIIKGKPTIYLDMNINKYKSTYLAINILMVNNLNFNIFTK